MIRANGDIAAIGSFAGLGGVTNGLNVVDLWDGNSWQNVGQSIGAVSRLASQDTT